MRRMALENEYVDLRSNIAKMTSITSSMMMDVVKAMIYGDSKLAGEVILRDDDVDKIDNNVDNICIKVLALYEPKALDLRYIITVLRITVDIERIGDHCVNMANEIIKLNQFPPLKPYIDLPIMGNHAEGMLKDAVNAFFNKDSDLAVEILERDQLLDNLYIQITRELMTYASDNLNAVKLIMSLNSIAKSLERIGDYTKNISEQVYYMVTGKSIKHQNYKEADSE